MANLSKTRTVFAFTSPRTIEKIIPEIQVLIDTFSGEEWNTNSQIAFYDKLCEAEFLKEGCQALAEKENHLRPEIELQEHPKRLALLT